MEFKSMGQEPNGFHEAKRSNYFSITQINGLEMALIKLINTC